MIDEDVLKILNESDEDDVVDVLTEDGKIVFVSLDDYLKHKAYYDNLLTRKISKEKLNEHINSLKQELKSILEQIKKVKSLSRDTVGPTFRNYMKELGKLYDRRDSIYDELEQFN